MRLKPITRECEDCGHVEEIEVVRGQFPSDDHFADHFDDADFDGTCQKCGSHDVMEYDPNQRTYREDFHADG